MKRSISYYCMVFWWDLTTGKQIRIIEYFSSNDEAFPCFSPDGKHILMDMGAGKNLTLFDLTTGQCIHSMEESYRYFQYVSFSPDGRHALSQNSSGNVKLWDVATGKCIHILDTKRSNDSNGCFSPDGRHLLTGYNDSTSLMLWDLKTGKGIRTMGKAYSNKINSVCFSPDGKCVFSRCEDGIMKLWDVTTGECIYYFRDFFSKRHINRICLSPDGRSMAIDSEDSTPYFEKSSAEESEAIHILNLDFDLHFPGWHDWDEGARPYLDIFLTLHLNWTDDDFNNILIPDLQNRGYGWLRPEGVKAELEMSTPKAAEKETDQMTLTEIALKAPDNAACAIAVSKLTDQSVPVVNRVSVTAEQPKSIFTFDRGESVKINDGPFKDFTGVVQDVYPERYALKVIITILGRTTPVDIETELVEKI